MSDPDADRLKALHERIERMKAPEEAPKGPDQHTQAQIAWRMVIELVAGLGIGFAIGYGLDLLFGTRPFLMVLFILLGFVAGVKTMLSTATELAPGGPHSDAPAGAGNDGAPLGPKDEG